MQPKFTYNELETKDAIKALTGKLYDLNAKADLSPEGNDLRVEIVNQIGELEEHLEMVKVPAPLSVAQNSFPGSPGQSFGKSHRGNELLPPQAKKDFKNLFGSTGGYRWPDKDSTFFAAATSGQYHPGLIKNSMSETVPSDGGFLVPGETAAKIHSVSLEDEIVMPRCYVQPMTTNEITVPAMAIGSHATHLFGAFTASYTPEAGNIDENNPKVRAMKLNAHKLTGYIRYSSELQLDTPSGVSQIENICGKGLAWYRDRAFLKGTGAGEPQGILNSPALIVVAKESAQTAKTILYENLTNLMAAMYAGSFPHSVWLCHQSCIPQLLQLSLAVGTGGNAIPVLNESNGQFTMLTRPVIFSEKTYPLGSQGDIALIDFSAYIVGLRNEMRFDTSIHVGFQTDELVSRLIERHDGQGLWDTPLTLEDGVTKVSPFVTLAAR